MSNQIMFGLPTGLEPVTLCLVKINAVRYHTLITFHLLRMLYLLS